MKEDDENCMFMGLVIREMVENSFACKDFNAGGPDKRMSSTMKKTRGGISLARAKLLAHIIS